MLMMMLLMMMMRTQLHHAGLARALTPPAITHLPRPCAPRLQNSNFKFSNTGDCLLSFPPSKVVMCTWGDIASFPLPPNLSIASPPSSPIDPDNLQAIALFFTNTFASIACSFANAPPPFCRLSSSTFPPFYPPHAIDPESSSSSAQFSPNFSLPCSTLLVVLEGAHIRCLRPSLDSSCSHRRLAAPILLHWQKYTPTPSRSLSPSTSQTAPSISLTAQTITLHLTEKLTFLQASPVLSASVANFFSLRPPLTHLLPRSPASAEGNITAGAAAAAAAAADGDGPVDSAASAHGDEGFVRVLVLLQVGVLFSKQAGLP
jgi:hypothetical protein